MANLDANQRRGIAAFFREHAKLHRELASAKALLDLCEQKKLYPQNWKQTLEEMKKTPAYGTIAQGYCTGHKISASLSFQRTLSPRMAIHANLRRQIQPSDLIADDLIRLTYVPA